MPREGVREAAKARDAAVVMVTEAHPNAQGLEEVFLRILEEESDLIIPKDAL